MHPPWTTEEARTSDRDATHVAAILQARKLLEQADQGWAGDRALWQHWDHQLLRDCVPVTIAAALRWAFGCLVRLEAWSVVHQAAWEKAYCCSAETWNMGRVFVSEE